MANILVACGVFWIIFALTVNARQFSAAIWFKVIPLFTGLATLLCAMDLYGWVNISWVNIF
jgi:hypothetical protein